MLNVYDLEFHFLGGFCNLKMKKKKKKVKLEVGRVTVPELASTSLRFMGASE